MATTPRQRSGLISSSGSSSRTSSTTSASATIYSVAERAGVSIATVSRVLQGSSAVSAKTTQKVLDAAERAQLRAARRRPQPRRAPPRGARPRPARARPAPTTPSCSWASSRRAAELGQSVVAACSPRARPTSPGPCASSPPASTAIAVLGSAAIPPAVARALHGQQARRPHRRRRTPATASRPSAPRTPHSAAAAHRARARPRPHAARSSSATPTAAPTSATATPASSPPTSARGLDARPSRCRVPFREGDGTAVADRLLAGELERRRARLRQRRARAVDHDAAAGRRPRRPRRHRRRRLGRRHDLPLRRARA